MKPENAPTSSRPILPLLALLVATQALAQQPPAEPPPAAAPVPAPPASGQPMPKTPLVPRAPARSEWSVRMIADFPGSWETEGPWEQAPAAASEIRTVRSVDFSKDAATKTYRLKTRWSDGKSEEEWIVMGQHVAERPGGRGLYIVGAEATTAQDLTKSDFPELDWLELSNYRGLKTYKGKPVFTFSLPFDKKRLSRSDAQLLALAKQADPSMTASKFFKPKSPQVVVYLDAVTQYPVLYNDGSLIRRYDFGTTPAGSLRPSPAVLKFLRDRQAALRTRLATPPGP